MINEYRFFQDFFDGQIVKPESEKFKLFKIMLPAVVSVIGLFLYFSGICNIVEFLILECGVIWNLCLKLGSKISLVFCCLTCSFYFFYTSIYGMYATGLIYVACYIPFQLIATTKDYDGGDFIQIRKKMTDVNKIAFFLFFMMMFAFLFILSATSASTFSILDSIVASLLVCSALLRNERYAEYYSFRILALLSSIVLWFFALLEFGQIGIIAIILMYSSYLIYDVVNYFYQNLTYVNQMMIQKEKYDKIYGQLLINEKLEVYKKYSENKNKK